MPACPPADQGCRGDSRIAHETARFLCGGFPLSCQNSTEGFLEQVLSPGPPRVLPPSRHGSQGGQPQLDPASRFGRRTPAAAPVPFKLNEPSSAMHSENALNHWSPTWFKMVATASGRKPAGTGTRIRERISAAFEPEEPWARQGGGAAYNENKILVSSRIMK